MVSESQSSRGLGALPQRWCSGRQPLDTSRSTHQCMHATMYTCRPLLPKLQLRSYCSEAKRSRKTRSGLATFYTYIIIFESLDEGCRACPTASETQTTTTCMEYFPKNPVGVVASEIIREIWFRDRGKCSFGTRESCIQNASCADIQTLIKLYEQNLVCCG